MPGNGLAGKDAPAALGGALPGLEPAEEAARLGIDREAVVAGLAPQPRPGVEHVQAAEEDLVMGGDRLGSKGGIGRKGECEDEGGAQKGRRAQGRRPGAGGKKRAE